MSIGRCSLTPIQSGLSSSRRLFSSSDSSLDTPGLLVDLLVAKASK